MGEDYRLKFHSRGLELFEGTSAT